jgi:pimeloyl-ACP methyl ester carboxylesterase
MIFLAGLTDGLLSIPYIDKLASKLESMENSCSLIQPILRSSYLQYGWHTIHDDCDDLQRLIDYLLKNRANLQTIILMGHSTGCQDIIHYLRRVESHPKITRVILQGAVSDRQYLSQFDSTKELLNYCSQRQLDPSQWLPRELHDPPITIERCQSLNGRNSIEDLFSSDLTDEELKNIYEKIFTGISWIWSKEDQYVPQYLREEVQHFVEHKLAKKNGSTFLLLEHGDHAVSDEHEQDCMIEHIVQLIS